MSIRKLLDEKVAVRVGVAGYLGNLPLFFWPANIDLNYPKVNREVGGLVNREVGGLINRLTEEFNEI